MKLISKLTLLALSVGLFSTCEKFEVKPLTKVETGTATPQANTITVNAKIIDLSGEGNTDHGFCYATQNEPTIDDSKVSKGNPKVGEFTSTIDGLTLNTQYYVRAYCQSSVGIVYGKAVAITTLDGQSALTTTSVTSITATTATSGGNIASDGGAPITARGVVWSTTQDPTVGTNNGITSNGTGTGSFTSNVTNLQPGTVYYVRAYATNSIGTVYGNQQTFTTQDGLPVLTTTSITSVTATSAISGGNITSDGGFAVTARGVVWCTNQNPTVGTNIGITSNGTGIGGFTSNLTGLTPTATYYVRAYATNSVGTSYGDEQTFTTLDGVISLSTAAITGITATTATSGGNITSDGGAAVIARGVVWSTSQNPTTTNNQGITTNGMGIGSFTSNLTNLQPGTVYYVRAYATNSVGTSYGNQHTFTTQDGLPTLTTTAVTSITATTATTGGTITSDGGFAVTARGVVWSTSQSPTVGTNNGITSNGTGTGSWVYEFVDLEPQTVYYVRAYASNSVGTSYGNSIVFKTAPANIGDSFGGGVIAYILQPGDPGYVAGETHGLIAARYDQSSGAQWGCYGISISGTSTALGSGMANTLAILNQCTQSSIAARICHNLELNGYSDWYLPSYSELCKLFDNRVAIGGFESYDYWSSSEYSSNVAWIRGFNNGYVWTDGAKNKNLRVRAVRAF